MTGERWDDATQQIDPVWMVERDTAAEDGPLQWLPRPPDQFPVDRPEVQR